MKRRVAIVVPRCHERIVGGIEALGWQYAQLLAAEHEVEVLTSTAIDYQHWNNELEAGLEQRDGIGIRRFAVARGRSPHFGGLHRMMLDAHAATEEAAATQRYGWTEALEEEFIRTQGPNCPALARHLATQGDAYDAVFLMPYLYPTTLDAARALTHRRWALVPAVHDEPPAYVQTFARLARRAPLLLWNAPAEQRLGARIWGAAEGQVLAMTVATEAARPAAEPEPYLLYCGRIDVSKGCAQLLEDFAAYKGDHPRSRLQLVLTGNDVLGVGNRKDVRYLGFVEEARKAELMAGAVAFIQPSPYESLSIVLLEAMAQKAPVIVNGQCEVLVDHVRASGSGRVYRGQAEFIQCVREVSTLDSPAREAEGSKARDYVLQHYSRERIQAGLNAVVEALASR